MNFSLEGRSFYINEACTGPVRLSGAQVPITGATKCLKGKDSEMASSGYMAESNKC